MNRPTRSFLSRPGASASWLFLLFLFARFASAAGWTPVGPGASWRYAVRSLTVQASSAGGLWLGMPHGALYRSRDRGARWTWVGRPLGGNALTAVYADKAVAGRLFAANRTGVYRTDDGGSRWVRVSAPGFTDLLGDYEPESLAATPDALYVSTGSRVLASFDGGRSFEVRFELTPDVGFRFVADPWRAGRLYVAYRIDETVHVKKSLDAGRSWFEIVTPPATEPGLVPEMLAAGGTLYLSFTTWPGVDPSLWGSRDGGATWSRLLYGDVRTLFGHPNQPRTLYATWSRAGGPSEVVVTRDGGLSWRPLGAPPFYLDRLTVDPGSGTLYGLVAGSDHQSALLRSADGKTWETVFVAPSTEAEVARLTFRPGRAAHQAITVGWNLYRSFDGGASWSWRALPFRPGAVELDADPNRLIAISGLGTYLSEDAGRTWKYTSSSLFYGEGLVRRDRDTLFAIGCGVTRSGDDGETWRVALPCFATDGDPPRWTPKLDVDPLRPERVYALAFPVEIDGLPHGPLNDWPSHLWRSEDGGQTWKKATANLRAFALERGTGRLYGARGTKLLASDDAGRSWRIVGTAPEEVLDLIADPATPGALYANGRAGLQWSPDRGTTWRTVNPGGGWVLQFDPTNPKTIYTSTEDGVYRLALP